MNPTLAALADRYERDQCPAIATGLRDANQTGRPVLIWRALRPRGFQTDAQPIPDHLTPAETWHACQMSDPDAYDRPAVIDSHGGPYSIHSPTRNHATA
mgnify:FL=1